MNASDARVILFLQGPSSLFFSRLGEACAERGAQVLRANFCPGDWLYWRRPGGMSVRGRLEDWPGTLRRLIAERGVTDIVMLGDGRPRHRAAVEIAAVLGLRAHCVELGYFRPDWLTHEIGGMAATSLFPREPAAIRALPTGPPPDGAKIFRSSFLENAALDVGYNLSNVLFSLVSFPRYRHHSIYHPVVEYAGWIRKLVLRRRRNAAAEAAIERLLRDGAPFFVLPLQLANDFQILRHGPGGPLQAIVADTVRSFAANAAPDARLLVKLHPLDNGWIDWAGLVREAAGREAARCVVVDGGDLDRVLAACEGVVLVNSTVGLSALRAGKRVKLLGRAIYDVPGLVDPSPLAGFWRSRFQPDMDLVDHFVGALARHTQVRGAFDGEGVTAGAEAIAERIMNS